VLLLVLCTLGAPDAIAADPPWQIKSADGKSSLAFGVLVQPQGEFLTTPDGLDTSKNLYLRRLRLIFGGKATEWLSFFIDTDSPNLGKGNADGTKVQEKVFIQDAIFTVTARPEFQIDAGMLLVPVSHNTGQSAATLLAPDYGPYSFLAADPANSFSLNGRDYGAQARGYVASHLEYRAGVFQGRRGTSAAAPFRCFGRVVWYPLDAETGFFYSGTTLGAKRIVALGASVDHQDDYTTRGVDLYVDQPVRGGDAATFQLDFIRYDGGRTLPALAAQSVWLVEAGYYIHGARLEPFVQVASDDPSSPSIAIQRKYQGGVAYWANGHRYNVKLGVARMTKSGAPDRTQVVVQGQIFVW
jgi:hypothetical protein